MPTEIGRNEVQRLLNKDAQIVEVLSSKEYAKEHLPGAINLPLKKLERQAASELKRDAPVIVYCYDYQ